MPPPPAPSRTPDSLHDPVRQRALRHWRIVALLYWLALTTGTHWPELQVRVGPGPPPDKVLHLLAFGGLTLLVWQCRLFKYIWQAGLACALWALFDEWTQSLPILNRQTSWMDVTAGELGVTAGALWIWATAPVGPTLSRWRRAAFDQAIDLRLSRTSQWMTLGIAAGLIAVCAAVESLVLQIALLADHDPFIAMLIASGLAFVLGVHATFSVWWNRDAAEISARRRCFTCGHDCEQRTFDSSSSGACVRCGRILHQLQWSVRLNVSRRRLRRIVFINFFGLWYICLIGIVGFEFILRSIDNSITQSQVASLRSVVQLFSIVFTMSLIVRQSRIAMCSIESGQHESCVNCGYDVTAQPIEQGAGRCPECGTPFARMSKERTGGADA